MTVRSLARLARFLLLLLLVLARFLLLRLGGAVGPVRRARWLHWSCRRIADRLGFRVRVEGAPPERGLLVSNHLSYIDILLYASILPVTFVAKREVASWPLLGLAARCAGSIFVDRASLASAAAARLEVAGRLRLEVPVLVFPEGTSTDGSAILPFRAALIEPAVRAGVPVTAAAVRYLPGPGGTEADLCYYGDVVFLPHFLKVLALPRVEAVVSFAEPVFCTDRRMAAETAENLVRWLRAAQAAAATV
jgi:1-acyl-sn-glycerol-3-phosphate acyltransferase